MLSRLRQEVFKEQDKVGLNPCCNGSCSHGVQAKVLKTTNNKSLNPCCNGSCSHGRISNNQISNPAAGLNPCCNGSCSHGQVYLTLVVLTTMVLILVVMYHALTACSINPDKLRSLRVLILVVMDHALTVKKI